MFDADRQTDGQTRRSYNPFSQLGERALKLKKNYITRPFLKIQRIVRQLNKNERMLHIKYISRLVNFHTPQMYAVLSLYCRHCPHMFIVKENLGADVDF